MTDTCGPTSCAPFARWDHDSQSWKTSEATSLWALTLSSLTLPAWGGLHDGELCEHPTPELHTSAPDFSSLPTPNAADGKRYNLTHQRGEGNPTLLGAVRHLPTPSANDTTGAEDQAQRQNRGAVGPMLRDLPSLLPTPAVNDMGEGKTLEWWDDWAPRQMSSDGRPAPHGRSLAIEAQRMLPTPRAQNGEERNSNIWERPLDQPQNLENALARIGATTGQRSAVGKQSSGDPHQHQLSLEEMAQPA